MPHMFRRWIVKQEWGLWIGLGLTAAAVAVHLSGLTERIELLGFDYHVRHFSRIPASDRIVHVDIDDDSLARVESWPWPRDLQAELIRILHELGASHIAMDIGWPEPKHPEVRLPTFGRYADIEGEIQQIGELSPENVVYPDDELARAIAESAPVYLSMWDDESGTGYARSPLAGQIAEALRQDFGLHAADIAQRLNVQISEVEDILAGIKRQIAEEKVAAILRDAPTASAGEVHAKILSTPFDRETADRADVLSAYYRQLGVRELRSKCPPLPEKLKGKLAQMHRIVPPLYKLTAGARRAGFVSFRPDIDGRTRHIPLLMEWDGHLVEQMAFTLACDLLNIEPQDLSIEAGHLIVAARGDRPAFRVQLDEKGQMLVNWHIEPQGWQNCFTHVPVTQLLRIYDCRKAIKENGTRRQLAIARAMRLAKDDTAYEGYRQQVNEMLVKERKVHWGRLQGRGETDEVKAAAARAAELRQLIEADQKETIDFIHEQWANLKKEPNPQAADIAADYKRFEEADRLISTEVPAIARVNDQIAAEQRTWMERLRPKINGKLCFVGYTATAVADMVTTPSYPRMPGVLVHSNLLNSFLQGQFRRWSPRWMQAVIIALFGISISFITATRGMKITFLLLMLVIASSLVLNAVAVFERLDLWIRLLTALMMSFIIWAIIVLFRFFTTDRQKRQFSKAVSQYVSPAVAKQIAGSARTLDLSPVNGNVTCFFSDLEGFTRMSERLGPEGTKTVLNPYLEAMSAVLHRRSALINKFIGDGIFAFFNPPILPCAEHHAAACEAALDSQQALHELTMRYAGHPMSDEFRRLRMRIGISSGPVFVGDYGSENKLDYTCMGDTVNLASRLEGANKVFDTAILMAGTTRDALADRFACRSLGLLQVKGQTVAVRIYELLGRSGQVNGDAMRFADLFDEGVTAFCRRDWSRSGTAFARCLELRPNETGTQLYLKFLRAYQDQPPPENWNMAIELTEK